MRFEHFIQGLQDYEKARLLLEEWSADPSRLSALQAAIDAFTYEEIAANGPDPALRRLRTLINSR